MSNPFDAPRKTVADIARKHSVYGVQRSLWTNLQAVGYEPSPGAKVAWVLVRAASPGMTGHKDAVAMLAARSAAERVELLEVARKTLGAQSVKASHDRLELAQRIVTVLVGATPGVADSDASESQPDASGRPWLQDIMVTDPRSLGPYWARFDELAGQGVDAVDAARAAAADTGYRFREPA